MDKFPVMAATSLLFAFVAAVATAATALLMWRQQRGTVIFERLVALQHLPAGAADCIEVAFTVRNATAAKIKVYEVRTKGVPLVGLSIGSEDAGVPTGRAGLAPVYGSIGDVDPGRAVTLRVRVLPDWGSWSAQRRSSAHVSWSMSIMFVSMNSPMRTMRHRAKLKTARETIRTAAAAASTSSGDISIS